MEGGSMNDRLHLPAPSPYSGPNRCGSCLGAGITGVRYEMALPAVNVGGVQDPGGGTVLVVDEICDACQGCGRAGHEGCRWDEHADAEAVDFDRDDDLNDDEEPDEHECLSCGGRHWFPVQGFNEQRATVLRVPCGCAEGLLVEAP
jgi:hypothetical protein